MRQIEKTKSQQGFSLVSTMVGLTVASIGMFAMMQMMESLNRENRALSEKIEFNDLKRLLTSSLSDNSICSSMVSGLNQVLPTNTQGLQRVDLQFTSIPSSSVSGSSALIDVNTPFNGTVNVGSINMRNFRLTSPNRYVADLVIALDSNNLVRDLAPFSMTFNVSTDASNRIVSCDTSGGTSTVASAGSTCGLRGAVCGANTVHYDMYQSDSIACEGNQLTASCQFRTGNMTPTLISQVQGCPGGYTGRAVYTGTYWVHGYYNQYFTLTCVKN